MKLRLIPNFISKLCKHHFSNSNCKNCVPVIVGACQKITLSSPPADNTRRIRSVLGTKSVNELLCLVGNTKREFESAEVAASCQKLSEHVFKVLKLQPWAVDNEHILWNQSKINTDANGLLCNVLQSSEFSLILQNVKKHIGTFTCTQLLTVTKSLLNLHVPMGDDVMSALLHECIQRHHDFSLAELATFSNVCNDKRGVSIWCIVAHALQLLVAERPLWNNLDDFNSISTILSNISYVSSESFLAQLLPGFKELFCKYDYQTLTVHIDDILSCSRSFIVLLAKSSNHSEFVKKLVGFFMHHVDTLSLWNLERACILISELSAMTNLLSDLFQKRAFEFLRQWLSASDVMSIIQIADKTVRNETLITETINALENVLIDFDVQLLKFLAKTRFLTKIKNYNVTHQFSQCVMGRLPDVTNDRASLKSIVQLFSILHCKNYLFHKRMIEHLVDKLRFDQMGLMPKHVGPIFKYIIFCGRFAYIPTNLKESFRQMMHQLKLRDAIILTHQMFQLVNFDKSLEIQRFATEMKSSVLKRGSEVKSLATVNLLVNHFSRRSIIEEIETNTVYFSELYDKHAPAVNSSSLRGTCLLLREHKLLAPQALQSLADFLISRMDMDHQNDLSLLGEFSWYLETCAILNFCPANISDLEQLITKNLIQTYACMGNDILLSTVLSIVQNLVVLEVFPRDLLNLVFSLRFLKTFDAVCQGASSLDRQKYEDQLYNLNRSVLLECPHLNIPWFHETFGEVSAHRNPNLWKPIMDQLQVEQQLEEVLGGPQYFKANQLSPYFYVLDFECMLTKCGLPVPISNWTKLSNLQRIAILLLLRSDYCSNVQQVLGPVAVKLRHLEIMGYRVVQVPYEKLHSDSSPMSHEKAVDLKHFLSERLFDDYRTCKEL